MVIAQSQAGPIERVPNLKKRQRSIYYQPDGKGGWLQTRPLPSDANGRELYLSKGFRLKPEDTPTSESEKETLLAKVNDLENKLKMAKAREARGKS